MAKLLKVDKVAERLGVCRDSVWRYIRMGKLKAIKLSVRNFRVEERDLTKFLKKHKTK